MVTPYKGKIRIACSRDICREDRSRADATAGCVGCDCGTIELLDLADRAILALSRIPPVEVKRARAAPAKAAPKAAKPGPKAAPEKGKKKR